MAFVCKASSNNNWLILFEHYGSVMGFTSVSELIVYYEYMIGTIVDTGTFVDWRYIWPSLSGASASIRP